MHSSRIIFAQFLAKCGNCEADLDSTFEKKRSRGFGATRSGGDTKTTKKNCASCTVIGARIYVSGLIFDPRVNLDEFGDEARYVTLDNCSVPPKDVFVHHVHRIPLPDNCNQTPVSDFTIRRKSPTLAERADRSSLDFDQSQKRNKKMNRALVLQCPKLSISAIPRSRSFISRESKNTNFFQVSYSTDIYAIFQCLINYKELY